MSVVRHQTSGEFNRDAYPGDRRIAASGLMY